MKQPGLDRSFAHTEHIRNFLHRQLMMRKQNEHFPVFHGEIQHFAPKRMDRHRLHHFRFRRLLLTAVEKSIHQHDFTDVSRAENVKRCIAGDR